MASRTCIGNGLHIFWEGREILATLLRPHCGFFISQWSARKRKRRRPDKTSCLNGERRPFFLWLNNGSIISAHYLIAAAAADAGSAKDGKYFNILIPGHLRPQDADGEED